MTLSNSQLNKIVDIYATALVESMDQKMLENFVYETIVEKMSSQSENDILDELYAYYEEDEANEIVESVRTFSR